MKFFRRVSEHNLYGHLRNTICSELEMFNVHEIIKKQNE
jgi:hypothetical protein